MADEVSKAQTATPSGDTIFGKITRGEIDCKFIYEDDQVIVIGSITTNLVTNDWFKQYVQKGVEIEVSMSWSFCIGPFRHQRRVKTAHCAVSTPQNKMQFRLNFFTDFDATKTEQNTCTVDLLILLLSQ